MKNPPTTPEAAGGAHREEVGAAEVHAAQHQRSADVALVPAGIEAGGASGRKPNTWSGNKALLHQRRADVALVPAAKQSSERS